MSGWRNDALTVACPKCGAAPTRRCRSLTTNRSTDVHVARFEARYPQYATAPAPRPSTDPTGDTPSHPRPDQDKENEPL